MPLLTTTIGAYPKPDYVPVPDWFQAAEGPDTGDPTRDYLKAIEKMGDEAEAIFARAAREVIEDQLSAGIDIPTDGEVRRENYIHYHCRHLDGFDFETLEEKTLRGGAYNAALPRITGPVRARAPFLPHDWRVAQAVTDRPVKVTLPGPMTIADTTVDRAYGDERKLGTDLAEALNAEIRALAEAGCTWIQVDEPVLARKPDAALDYGIEHLDRCFHGVPEGVERVMHMCCGYPDALDRHDYPKADPQSYFRLADAVDRAVVDVVSIEDAHRPNDLALLERFAKTKVILGVVAIAKRRVESVEEIRARLAAALEHIEPERLIAAPDCGLGLLGRERALEKLTNLCAAAQGL
ncbi:MAG: cobalamin-independent methionine synthase II family protein [Rhodospirillales bacterium]|nr:cobalamin-independent methionine synthase II family protein [Rhodospirillales bacterium]MDH3791679.1 cobalamin-independent methionine synthase II family protein [Rhodospirillales bacterium]MDH3913099.1 cobalamin-independent methionine synthase II family protein [Rhodospirillales bacterium]MDH3917833.1 cobalamin-independent methionine synthase II family protein [Rhodospirillales bacterium]MDH3967408.1 cobalamin-independent methionine synthase II family protein [Rhodospirillales bacterium]